MPKSETTLKLGDLAKCKITGFEGVIVARTDWINGCVRMALQAKTLDKDGKPLVPETFDVEQLELVKPEVHEKGEASGGPCDDRTALRR